MSQQNHRNEYLGLGLGVFLFFIVLLFADFAPGLDDMEVVAAVSLLMSVLWITEAVPLAITSLLPLILLPFFGVVSGKDLASSYINSTIFLFLGGFIIALSMEKWNLHRRIALHMVSRIGKNPVTLVLGFMIAAAVLSMWISNTATAIMLLPIGLAILYKVEETIGEKNTKKFSLSLMLGIAYGCSVGGIATVIGTPTNLVFRRIYAITFPQNAEIVFSEWMIFALPISIVMLAVVWLLLVKVIYPPEKEIILEKGVIRKELNELGRMSFEEKAVSIIFAATAFLWMFRKEADFGGFIVPGWSGIFPESMYIDDGTVAMMMAVVLFIIPAKNRVDDSKALLDIGVLRRVPWDIILLFGGGFALAQGFMDSGLSELIGRQFAALSDIHILFFIGAVCITITFLTELTSNTATAQIVLPILAAISIELSLNPLVVMIPATLSASMAFMMPVATPPNAIVFGSGRIRVPEMARAGIALNIIGAVVITIVCYLFFA